MDLAIIAKSEKKITNKRVKKLYAILIFISKYFIFVFIFLIINFSIFNFFLIFNSF